MHRKIVLRTVALAALTLLAACNRETANTNASPDQTAANRTAQNEPAPGSKNDTVSAAKDAIAGAVGTVSAELTNSTEGFVDAAAVNDMFEIQAGRLAIMRAQMPELKRFAQQMVDAHTETSDRLKSVLMKAAPEIMLPAQLDSRRVSMLNDLKGAKDEDFDGRYIAQQINAHDEALILMRGYAKDGDNDNIKRFAAETLPKVQMHLDTINDIDRKHRASDAQARNSGSDNSKTR